jgi:uncharacterized protein YeeX (DUF496 family)
LLDRAKNQPHTDISKINRRINLNQKTVSLMQRENPESTEISNLSLVLEQVTQKYCNNYETILTI